MSSFPRHFSRGLLPRFKDLRAFTCFKIASNLPLYPTARLSSKLWGALMIFNITMHHAARWGRPSLVCVIARFRNGLYGGNKIALQTRTLANRNKRRSTKSTNNSNASRGINANIVDLGKQHKWKDLLQVYEKEKLKFNNVNYSTIMSQLARIRSLDTQDATLLELVGDLPQKLKHFDARCMATTANSLAKMRIPKHKRYLTVNFFAELDMVSDILFEKQDCRYIALAVHASAKAKTPAPNLFANLDRNADWFLLNGNPQYISNSVWLVQPLE